MVYEWEILQREAHQGPILTLLIKFYRRHVDPTFLPKLPREVDLRRSGIERFGYWDAKSTNSDIIPAPPEERLL